MLLGGNKSYYDEYVRKSGSGRTLNDPPSLLTDRGAYVNFLEVQLERVSAACLGVNAYDQRFNDMQSLIVSLEQRCASTTRLVGLAQQCTEEVRLEADHKVESMVREARNDHANVNAMFQAVSTRLSAAEQSVAVLGAIAGRVESLEAALQEALGALRAQAAQREEERLAASARIEELESSRRSLAAALDKVQTDLSKQALDIEESNRRTSNAMISIEDRLTSLQTKHKEELSERLQETSSRMVERLSESYSKLSADHTTLNADLQTLQHESARRAELIEKSLPKAYNDAIMNAANTACELYRAQAEEERQQIEEEIAALQQGLLGQQERLVTFEDEARQQFEIMDQGMGEFSDTADEAQRKAAAALQEALIANEALRRVAEGRGLGAVSAAAVSFGGGDGQSRAARLGERYEDVVNAPPPVPAVPPPAAGRSPSPRQPSPARVGVFYRDRDATHGRTTDPRDADGARGSPRRGNTPEPRSDQSRSPARSEGRRLSSPSAASTGKGIAGWSTSPSREHPRSQDHWSENRSESRSENRPGNRSENGSERSYRSRVSPFFSRLPHKARGSQHQHHQHQHQQHQQHQQQHQHQQQPYQPLWLPSRSVSSRQGAQLSVQQRAARVMERQRAALARYTAGVSAPPPPTTTTHAQSHGEGGPAAHQPPPARYDYDPADMASVHRLSQGPLRTRSTRDIVSSMMMTAGGSMGNEVDDNLTASTDSLAGVAVLTRGSIVPRDHLRGAAAKIAPSKRQ